MKANKNEKVAFLTRVCLILAVYNFWVDVVWYDLSEQGNPSSGSLLYRYIFSGMLVAFWSFPPAVLVLVFGEKDRSRSFVSRVIFILYLAVLASVGAILGGAASFAVTGFIDFIGHLISQETLEDLSSIAGIVSFCLPAIVAVYFGMSRETPRFLNSKSKGFDE